MDGTVSPTAPAMIPKRRALGRLLIRQSAEAKMLLEELGRIPRLLHHQRQQAEEEEED